MLEKFITFMLIGRDRNEKGATATEYGLLVAFIALLIIVGVTALGNNLNTFFQGLAGDIALW